MKNICFTIMNKANYNCGVTISGYGTGCCSSGWCKICMDDDWWFEEIKFIWINIERKIKDEK